MVARLLKGNSPDELEKQLNEFFADHAFSIGTDERSAQALTEVKTLFPDMETTTPIIKKRLKIINVQQYTVGTVDHSTISISKEPVVNYSFQLLIMYCYE